MHLGKISLNWFARGFLRKSVEGHYIWAAQLTQRVTHLLLRSFALRAGWGCLWLNCPEDREAVQLWWNSLGRFSLVSAQCKVAQISRNNHQCVDRRVWDGWLENYEGIPDFVALLPCNGNTSVDLNNLEMIQELRNLVLFCPHPTYDMDLTASSCGGIEGWELLAKAVQRLGWKDQMQASCSARGKEGGHEGDLGSCRRCWAGPRLGERELWKAERGGTVDQAGYGHDYERRWASEGHWKGIDTYKEDDNENIKKMKDESYLK